ncbi:MAG: ferrous iron transport protein A [Bacillota bacterium]|nr:ferrous iron transport protein A [Bacillota bacterium]MDW7683449.1 ferrous iron transport protein A [Bacillota bacterium]
MMTLDKVKRGQKVQICNIPDEKIRAQAIRFGVIEGTEVICAEKLPAGPIVISKGYQELAIGRGLAQQITVKEVSTAKEVSTVKEAS